MINNVRMSESHFTPLTYNTLGKRLFLECSQAKISYLHRTRRTGDEDIVTLEITVNHGWCAAVKKKEALKNLPTPVLQYVDINFLEPPNVTTADINTARLIVIL